MPPGYKASQADPVVRPTASPNGSGSTSKTAPLLTRIWRSIKSIYYASTPAWQYLKSGALFLFGLFCWSSANLLLSYEQSWHWPYFLMAYGFLLTPYGPLTHLLLVPHLLPWLRRRTQDSWLHLLGRHLTLTSLTLFFGAVLWLGLSPPSVMKIDFNAGATVTADVNPALICAPAASDEGAVASCRLDNTSGVHSITVESGGTPLLRRTDPPFSFSLAQADLVEVVGQRQFQVVVHDETGAPVRRFNRTVSMIR